jgi:hypothetical protein
LLLFTFLPSRDDRVGLEVSTVVMTPILSCAIFVIGGQPGDPDDLSL